MTVPLNTSAPVTELTITSARRLLMTQFREAGLETPDLEARLLIMAAIDFTHTDMIARGTERLSAKDLEHIRHFAERRLAGEPIDHILGYREFYGRRFKISKDVLSPRPETEMLVDEALRLLGDKSSPHILDLGTGSGAIAISILAEEPHVQAVAVDLSSAAVLMTKNNAAVHQVSSRLDVLKGSWFEPVEGDFDLILSNPPYITDIAMDELETEVSDFDPDIALRGGEDGCLAYRAILKDAENYLKPEGHILFEIGYDQGKSVSALLYAAGFDGICVEKDLSGHDRMIKAAMKR